MSVKSLDHIQIAMPGGQEAEARAFYQDLLGIREVKSLPILLSAAVAGLNLVG
jgi:catechol 2,3-dioxygenase-like lactoylglutathione lyase family enzyme